MILEAGVVLSSEHMPLYWHVPPGRRAGYLPDDRVLWDVLWEHRHELYGFAHTHPCVGPPEASPTDVSTFAAIEAAIGRRLVWPIVSRDTVSEFTWYGPARESYVGVPRRFGREPEWLNALRGVSYRPSPPVPREASGLGSPGQYRGILAPAAPWRRTG